MIIMAILKAWRAIPHCNQEQAASNGTILTYTYSGNQLIKVEDAGSATNGFINGVNEAMEYAYDP